MSTLVTPGLFDLLNRFQLFSVLRFDPEFGSVGLRVPVRGLVVPRRVPRRVDF